MNARTEDPNALQLPAPYTWAMRVGSRVTCNPPPTDTDQDWLVMVRQEDWDSFAKALVSEKWVVGGSLIPNDHNYLPESVRFNSFVLGENNVIATCSDEFARRFLAASAIAKKFNLLAKQDRVDLFQAVLYGATASAEFAIPSPFDSGAFDDLLEEML